MDLLTKLLHHGHKLLAIVLLLSGVAWAKPPRQPQILATSYAVMDLDTGQMLKEHNATEVRSVASITKMMAAMVVLDANLNLDELIKIEHIKGISTKLKSGMLIPRRTLMHISLMSSDNLAAKSLAIHFPGGEEAFVNQMNLKAASLGMSQSYFTDPTGLLDTNISTAQDLIKLVIQASNYSEIKEYSTSENMQIKIPAKKRSVSVNFNTTNSLIKKYKDIIVSKTGWINKSGGCLVMLVQDQGRRRAIVVLNSRNTRTRILDGDLLYGMYNNGKNI